MKVRRLVLCILLSLTLVVTFIPVMSFAAPSEGQHAVTFDGIDSFVPEGEPGDITYHGYFEHGEVYGSIEMTPLYNTTDRCYYLKDGENCQFRIFSDEGWLIDAVEYTYDKGVTYEPVYEYTNDWYGFYMPSGNLQYDSVQVRISFARDPNYVISSINLGVKAPTCGTVVKNTYDVMISQPEVTIPAGSKYEIAIMDGYECTGWYDEANHTGNFTVKGGNVYAADILLRSKDDLTEFADVPTFNITGGKVSDYENLGYDSVDGCYYFGISVDVKAVHNWKWENTAAGLLKNGIKQQRCTKCGAVQGKTVVPGWATSYVKGMKVTKGKGKITVKWKKQSKANLKQFNGYQIRYATNANMAGAKYVTASKKAKSKKIGKLAKKTKYYVQVRTYTKTTAGTFYSGWTTKTVKTK